MAVVYDQDIAKKEVNVAYARIMLLGTAGVGKTCFTRSLMKEIFSKNTDSTILSDVKTVRPGLEKSIRPVRYGRQTLTLGKWRSVNEDDEIDELAQLFAIVLDDPSAQQHLLDTVAAHSLYPINLPLPPPDLSNIEVFNIKENKINIILSKAFARARTITSRDITQQPFLHIWDCGGQSVFLDILPAFLTPRTMFFLIFDASKHLNEKWENIRTMQGHSVCDEMGDTTTKDLLFNWMGNIHHNLVQLDEKTGGFRDYPRMYCIGTHGDQIEESKQQEIITNIKGQYKKKAFSHLIKDTLIVDNTTSGSNDEDINFHVIRNEVREFTSKRLVVKAPICWILFRKVIQMLEKKVINLKEAHAIGVACKIPYNNVPKALLFYHDLGALLYYPHIRGLQNKVILDPKWFVDTVGKVFTLEGREEKDTENMWILLREKGILVRPLYCQVWKDCRPFIEPDEIMKLLVHFRLAAEVETEEFYYKGVIQYFLPAVLKSFSRADSSSTDDSLPVCRSTDLHITFSTNFVPPGFFTRLVTSLTKSPLCKLLFESGVFRNHVSFKFGKPPIDDVTLTDHNDAIEVCISRYSDSSTGIESFNKTCQILLKLLEECGNEVDEVLNTSSLNYNSQPESMKISRQFRYVCASIECKKYEPHYLVPAATGQTSDLTLYCQKRKNHRRPTREEAFWFKEVQPAAEGVRFYFITITLLLFIGSKHKNSTT